MFSGPRNNWSFNDVPPVLLAQSKTTLGSSGFLGCQTEWWGRYYSGLRPATSSLGTCLDDPSVWYFSTTPLYLLAKSGFLSILTFNHFIFSRLLVGWQEGMVDLVEMAVWAGNVRLPTLLFIHDLFCFTILNRHALFDISVCIAKLVLVPAF